MTQADYDLAICGAGPTGCALALLMAQYRPQAQRIALIGRFPSAHNTPADPRALALNYGSQQLLESVSAWPTAGADITTVHVSQKDYLGRTLITAEDLGVPRLGAVVSYDALIQQLHQAIARTEIHFIQVDEPVIAQPGTKVHIDLGKGQSISSLVAVQSDGQRPQGLTRTYDQQAVLATVQSSLPASGWAYERFTKTGPFALLPHPQATDHYALIWCLPPEQAQQMYALSPRAFERALEQVFGARLGTLSLASERFIFPLSLHAGRHLSAERIVAIGNAAQTLHPVAGQGLNLGLRDVAQLAQNLRTWLSQPEQDPMPMLHQFTQQRQPDRWLTVTVTDTLARVFTSSSTALSHLLGLGLLSFDLCGAPRRSFTRHLLQGFRT